MREITRPAWVTCCITSLEIGNMKIRTLPSLLLLMTLLACLPWGPARAAAVADAYPPELAEAGLELDDQMLLDDGAIAPAPDLRILVAAPRAAITGRASSVLPVMRTGRVLNVETGERIRFLAGVREAVWYRGSGVVESGLALAGGMAGGPLVNLGRDGLMIPGSAPRIDRGLTRVDVTFEVPGAQEVAATVRLGVRLRRGKSQGVTRTQRYLVKVHEPGVLGSITGFIGREDDGRPLAGYPVLALNASGGQVVNGARTGCDGTYRIDRLPPGTYLVAVPAVRGFAREFYDDSPDAPGASPVEIDAGGSVGAVDFLLVRP